MLFDTTLFVWFFLLVFAGFWMLVRFPIARVLWLLVASYAFYAAWNPWLLSLILFSTVLDFSVGRAMGRSGDQRRRTVLLVVSLVGNLGLLALFKYADFFLGSIQACVDAVGAGTEIPMLDLVLPVGISFYTFQTLSYTIDIYRGELEPIESPLHFALFVSFFPQLVAGPIVRARDFLPQLLVEPRYEPERHGAALFMILGGMVKKIAIANYLAVNLVDRVFENPDLYSSVETLAAVYGYALQIYCDFSGYSDIAIGCALLLGFTLPINFNRPYISENLQDFWRRWHISLSTWLRDYLYIPLGGSRFSDLLTYRNLMITMLLGGLWHGPAWTFVAWGAMHGGALAANRMLQRRRAASRPDWKPSRAYRIACAFLTFHFVCACWILFRAPDFGVAIDIFASLGEGSTYIPNLVPPVLAAIAGGFALHLTPVTWKERAGAIYARSPAAVQAFALCAAAIVLQQIKGSDVVPFIYFQF